MPTWLKRRLGIRCSLPLATGIDDRTAWPQAQRNRDLKVKGQAVRVRASEVGQQLQEGAEARLDVGAALPEATLLDQRGKAVSISSLRGAMAVVYFYPKDDTPGCTREACAFRDGLSKFKRLSAKIVGISPDSVDRHARFADKYNLQFPLLSDESRDYARRCGVLVPKTLYGRTSIGIERSTFLLDGEGVIRRVWRKVKVDGHAEQVEQAIRELKTAE